VYINPKLLEFNNSGNFNAIGLGLTLGFMAKGASVPPEVWKKIKKAYLDGSETYASLAMRFGVGKSTIEAKASAEGWATLKKAEIIAPLLPKTSTGLPPRQSYKSGINEVEILQDAITVLSGAMYSAEARSAEGCASALAKLIELHSRLVPKTSADLADMAIALGVSPEDFIRQLSSKWQERA
jgi:hypothetical protein